MVKPNVTPVTHNVRDFHIPSSSRGHAKGHGPHEPAWLSHTITLTPPPTGEEGVSASRDLEPSDPDDDLPL